MELEQIRKLAERAQNQLYLGSAKPESREYLVALVACLKILDSRPLRQEAAPPPVPVAKPVVKPPAREPIKIEWEGTPA